MILDFKDSKKVTLRQNKRYFCCRVGRIFPYSCQKCSELLEVPSDCFSPTCCPHTAAHSGMPCTAAATSPCVLQGCPELQAGGRTRSSGCTACVSPPWECRVAVPTGTRCRAHHADVKGREPRVQVAALQCRAHLFLAVAVPDTGCASGSTQLGSLVVAIHRLHHFLSVAWYAGSFYFLLLSWWGLRLCSVCCCLCRSIHLSWSLIFLCNCISGGV